MNLRWADIQSENNIRTVCQPAASTAAPSCSSAHRQRVLLRWCHDADRTGQDDALQWCLDNASGDAARLPENLALRMLWVNFGALHSPTVVCSRTPRHPRILKGRVRR